MRAALALAAAAALLAGIAAAQPHVEAVGTNGAGREDVRDALSREIARLQADIAGIERLMRWQRDLTRTARTDRAEALRQRLPMEDCRASALAPLCDELTGLFRPEEGDGEGGAGQADPEARTSEGEGAR